jgi:hypothetical protein
MEERTTSTGKITLVYGLILGAALIAFSLVIYLLGLFHNKTVGYLTYVIMFAGIIIAQVHYRKNYADGIMTYGKACTVGFLTVLFASLINMIYSYIFLAYIDPGVLEETMARTEQEMLDYGSSEADVETTLKMMSFMQSPVYASIVGVVWGNIIGVILSLISAAFTKKEIAVPIEIIIRSDTHAKHCSVCNVGLISKAEAVQTANFSSSDRTCHACGKPLCFGCAAREGARRGLSNTCICPNCGANLNA